MNTPPHDVNSAGPPTRHLERFLSTFTDVRDGEGGRLLLMSASVFLILTAYYVMKPVREALILVHPGGAEVKSYAYAAQALLLLVVVPFYGSLANRMPRRLLINSVTAFFIGVYRCFNLLADAGVAVGVPFFLWIGIFSLMVIAQFWAYANDLYTPEAGKRLFALIAFGASSGAVFGAFLSGMLLEILGVNALLLVAASILGASLVLINLIDVSASRETLPGSQEGAPDSAGTEPRGGANPFSVVFRSKYLILIALVIFFVNWVNATGEYILSSIVEDTSAAMVASGELAAEDAGVFIGIFFSDYFQLVNITGMVLQLFVVSRVIKYLGVSVGVCILPLVALASYITAALIPALAIVRWIKTAENSVDYSLQNTVRHMLFLPTTREEKYNAKQVIDSFVVRAGDVMSAVTVFVGTAVLTLSITQFALVNVALVSVWLIAAIMVGREFNRLTDPS